jgi:hypothetical protein
VLTHDLWLGQSCQLLLIGVFNLAAFSKIATPAAFLTALKVGKIPAPLLKPVAGLLITLEIGLAAGLLLASGWALAAFFGAAASVLLVFSLWLAKAYFQKLDIACGCFGGRANPVGIFSLLRNSVLILVTLAGGFVTLGWAKTGLEPELASGWLVFLGAAGGGWLNAKLNRSGQMLIWFGFTTAPSKNEQLSRLSRSETEIMVKHVLATERFNRIRAVLSDSLKQPVNWLVEKTYAIEHTKRQERGVVVPWQAENDSALRGFYLFWLDERNRIVQTLNGTFQAAPGNSVTNLQLHRNERRLLELAFTPDGQVVQGRLYKNWRPPVNLTGQSVYKATAKLDATARWLVFG